MATDIPFNVKCGGAAEVIWDGDDDDTTKLKFVVTFDKGSSSCLVTVEITKDKSGGGQEIVPGSIKRYDSLSEGQGRGFSKKLAAKETSVSSAAAVQMKTEKTAPAL